MWHAEVCAAALMEPAYGKVYLTQAGSDDCPEGNTYIKDDIVALGEDYWPEDKGITQQGDSCYKVKFPKQTFFIRENTGLFKGNETFNLAKEIYYMDLNDHVEQKPKIRFLVSPMIRTVQTYLSILGYTPSAFPLEIKNELIERRKTSSDDLLELNISVAMDRLQEVKFNSAVFDTCINKLKEERNKKYLRIKNDKGVEDLENVRGRIRPLIDNFKKDTTQTTVVVAHGGILSSFLFLLTRKEWQPIDEKSIRPNPRILQVFDHDVKLDALPEINNPVSVDYGSAGDDSGDEAGAGEDLGGGSDSGDSTVEEVEEAVNEDREEFKEIDDSYEYVKLVSRDNVTGNEKIQYFHRETDTRKNKKEYDKALKSKNLQGFVYYPDSGAVFRNIDFTNVASIQQIFTDYKKVIFIRHGASINNLTNILERDFSRDFKDLKKRNWSSLFDSDKASLSGALKGAVAGVGTGIQSKKTKYHFPWDISDPKLARDLNVTRKKLEPLRTLLGIATVEKFGELHHMIELKSKAQH
jgi:broad specificity phosphatase PhoE